MSIPKITEQFEAINQALAVAEKAMSLEEAKVVAEKFIELFGILNHSGRIANLERLHKNPSWVKKAPGFESRTASYILEEGNACHLDFKLYWVNGTGKRIVSNLVALTPNYEDDPFLYQDKNIGIDFIVPAQADRLIIALTKDYTVRSIEVKGRLTNTQKKIFEHWFQNFDFKNKQTTHKILWDSLDIQSINNEFSKQISSFFIELVQHVVKKEILKDREASHFANRLIGRIIFCWFLNKKELINPEFGYLEVDKSQSSKEYYTQKLEPFFFQTLNTPLSKRLVLTHHPLKKADTLTPFLNGGLFEPNENDLYETGKISFPNDFFHRFYNDFLSHYNFTTDESTSDYQQVAIDPEMLGRIFENLLAEQANETKEQARKAKGAFYTPREIVDYMCNETLKTYVSGVIQTERDREKVLHLLFEKREHEWDVKVDGKTLKYYKAGILSALDEVKILDPAVGSGAFPMGMLHLMLKLYERLDPRLDSYKTKLQIIKNNIFGVDIEPMAVEIARLRTWLSIMVDEKINPQEENLGIEPLPNLDFKFVCANSLLPLKENGTMSFVDDPELENKMMEIRDQYFRARTQDSKIRLRKAFDELFPRDQHSAFRKSDRQEQIETYHPFQSDNVAQFFDQEFMFGLKFFDIVIGNPPYVQIQKMSGQSIQKQYENVGYKTFKKTGDLYCLFYERGLDLAKESTGVMCYITSNKWIRAGYGDVMRAYFAKKNPLKLLDFSGFKVFDSATVDTNVMLIRNEPNKGELKAVAFKDDFKKGNNLTEYVKSKSISLTVSSSNSWYIGAVDEMAIKKKIEERGTPLKDWDVSINFGIKTGCNAAFIIDEKTKDHLVKEDKKSMEIIKPVIRGKDVMKYGCNFGKAYLLFVPWHFPLHKDQSIEGSSEKAEKLFRHEYPAIYKHLSSFKALLMKRNQAETNIRYEWYALQRCANTYFDDLEKEKIVWKRIGSKIRFCYDQQGKYVLDSTCMATGRRMKFLIGVLNSSVGNYLLQDSPRTGTGDLILSVQALTPILIPKITTANETCANQIEILVEKIMKLKGQDAKSNIADLEKQIDDLVFELYGLTETERRIVFGN